MSDASGPRWMRAAPVAAPVLAVVVLAVGWGSKLSGGLVGAVSVVLAMAVLAAVHHAEVIAHRVGEPGGSLVLALAVTLIEVALIVTLIVGGGDPALARDTVFATIMITCNGLIGTCLLIGALRGRYARFNPSGAGAAFATMATLATLGLVLPTFTTSHPGPVFAPTQLIFAGVAAVFVYGFYVATQTIWHPDHFRPPAAESPHTPPMPAGAAPEAARESLRAGEDIAEAGAGAADEPVPDHDARPSIRRTLISLSLLLLALLGVVGLAKIVSPSIESGVVAAGLPGAVVGVVVALVVLLPETLAATRAARRGDTQTGINLAVGSAIASIGLTIPAVALASIWLKPTLILGLGATHIALLALTVAVGTLTVIPGRATLLQSGLHLAILAAYLVLAISP